MRWEMAKMYTPVRGGNSLPEFSAGKTVVAPADLS